MLRKSLRTLFYDFDIQILGLGIKIRLRITSQKKAYPRHELNPYYTKLHPLDELGIAKNCPDAVSTHNV